jgi:hypothetical protein
VKFGKNRSDFEMVDDDLEIKIKAEEEEDLDKKNQ